MRSACVLLFLALLGATIPQFGECHSEPYYDSSYAFLAVRSSLGEHKVICVNYQQWRNGELPAKAAEAEERQLGWWGGVNVTNVCARNDKWPVAGRAVALNYRIEKEDGSCAADYVRLNTSFKKAIGFEVGSLENASVSVGLLLVDKGRQFVSRWSDYLFSEFYDPDFNTSSRLPTFFIYRHVFFDEVLPLSRTRGNDGSDLRFRFYRPPSTAWDLSMFIIWLLAVFCVGVGGYWAGHRKTCEERAIYPAAEHSKGIDSPLECKERDPDDERMTTPANCIFVVVVMVIVVGILMLGFYFRNVMVYIFNIILAVVGTFSVHRCLSALVGAFCKCGQCKVCLSMNDVSRSIFRRDLFNYECCSRRPRVTSILLFAFSAALCILWFMIRRNPYAFILLDFINVTLCLHVLKGIRFPNLKWLAVLLLCMFVYDMFMVFGTPFLTKNGCSVMIEVAAGTDCGKSNTGYPVAPINSDIPEKFPMLFQVPRLSDPMMSCIDLDVEKEFHPVILGLGDVIVPGYLISFCFTVDFSVRMRHLYGIVSVVGYGLGLVATFCALTAMEMAQPALIYLIPLTLIPILVLSLIRKEFKMLWSGDFVKNEERSVSGIGDGGGSARGSPSCERSPGDDVETTSTSSLPGNEETENTHAESDLRL